MWYNRGNEYIFSKINDVETEDFNMSNINVSGGLGINTDVIEKMVTIASLEVEGVAALSNRNLDIKSVVSGNSPLKPVKVTAKNGAVDISVYISVKPGFKVKTVAEAVQVNVKDKLQDMTGNAITRVNVLIADLAEEEIAED
ncbi:MAG: Asp23/Gls24 family envelope stress response protein [Ruminococcaceae bacterium]|nr:Asp23/Gls24 family envelope stress response protein [Oscillospiraceae bacterium]